MCMLACAHVFFHAYDSMQILLTICRGEATLCSKRTIGQRCSKHAQECSVKGLCVQRNSHFISSTSALLRTRRSRKRASINNYSAEPRDVPLNWCSNNMRMDFFNSCAGLIFLFLWMRETEAFKFFIILTATPLTQSQRAATS